MYGGIGSGGDFPMGLGALLAGDALALSHFHGLGDDERKGIFDYLDGSWDEADREQRLRHTVKSLHDGVPGFYRQ